MKKKLYSITAVAGKTGLSPLVIRAWENRYNAVHPARNPSNRRLYSEEDIEKLLLLHQATQTGFRIGNIAQLNIHELSALIHNQTRKKPDALSLSASLTENSSAFENPDEFITQWMENARTMNVQAMEDMLAEASVQFSVPDIIQKLIIPVTVSTGEDWQKGTLRIHEEHLATNVIRQFLINAHRTNRPNPGAPVIVISTPAGQFHDIGALIVTLASASVGWNALYLGPDLPAEEIAAAAIRKQASAVALSIVYPPADSSVMTEIRRLRKLLPPDVRMLIGGQGTRLLQKDELPPGISRLNDPFLLNDIISLNRTQ